MGSDTPCDTREKYTKLNDYNTSKYDSLLFTVVYKKTRVRPNMLLMSPKSPLLTMPGQEAYLLRNTRILFVIYSITRMAESAWDIPFLNRKILLFCY